MANRKQSADIKCRRKHDFVAQSSSQYPGRMDRTREIVSASGHDLEVLYLGVAARELEQSELEVGFCIHDGTYSIDFAVHTIASTGDQSREQLIADYIVDSIQKYRQEHYHKYAGAGITECAWKLCPTLAARLWMDLDVVPMVFRNNLQFEEGSSDKLEVDEQADSMARKCIMYFGPTQQPRIQVGYRNEVEVDSAGHTQMTYLDEYKSDVSQKTWHATLKYAESLKQRKIKIAFFSSTAQGGGVALMRHALIRFLRELGIDAHWYTPRPKPEVFRITKTNHNILQGVAEPGERLSDEQAKTLDEWAEQNAIRSWSRNGGPLSARDQGGADFINVDDPQMPILVKIAKEKDPSRPVTWRSHIQVRSDLVEQKDTPTAQVWQWVYDRIKCADVFISHPVRCFVPNTIDLGTVGYMPATTDWLDGLNKPLPTWDTAHYIHEINTEAFRRAQPKLQYPSREYIVQIARFDPSKGIPDVLAAYATFRRKYCQQLPRDQTPQLVIAGHGSIDDPDGTRVLDETLGMLRNEYKDVADDVIALRLGPTDQLLNTLMSNAKVALQLSTREGFEVKVSEALHKGVPIIVTNAGGIPLQVEHEKSGFIVEPGDYETVATYLDKLFKDSQVYERMSKYAETHVSDEVGTVGNALCWLYLADTMTKGKKVRLGGKWVFDEARKEAGEEFEDGEVRLPRVSELRTV
ncbi:MAG: hypothetical protein M1820_000158 [Bogoriella megaspora]|nr:MAG: hypothetical protein M1820_000158 [Bogoriella megaspora]